MGAKGAAVARRPETDPTSHVRNHEGAPRLRLVIRDLDYVKSALERWARRRHGGSVGESSMTGKLMSGVRDNVCPLWLDDMAAMKAHSQDCSLCRGKGRIRLDESKRRRVSKCGICDPDGRFLGEPCFRCGGKKSFIEYDVLVNPAAIRGTGIDYGDVVSGIVDRMVASWRENDATIWAHRVIVLEYARNGTQPMKAKRLDVSLSFYEKRLHEGHYLTERELDAKLPNANTG
jgi:hypothetical protein